jgi:hypothetical protein
MMNAERRTQSLLEPRAVLDLRWSTNFLFVAGALPQRSAP